ncbi:hypothetical protein Pcinc_039810 [Petrolisthes cinctipes]|uniref:Uncharacterized protein n=1 Tax=Petrolisthes cinctipes TaxID=88211 RepID=A0AAE1BQG8_PETCI|nr:hypothetical protein Pcinc_039810 [Petrolisthes cinctipes]
MRGKERVDRLRERDDGRSQSNGRFHLHFPIFPLPGVSAMVSGHYQVSGTKSASRQQLLLGVSPCADFVLRLNC